LNKLIADKTIIHLKRTFPFRSKPLFEAFLNPEQFRKWFSPPGFRVIKVEMTPVAGGAYECELEKADGMKLVIRGKYEEIVINSKICFTFEYEPDLSAIGESKVTVSFNESGDNTEITLVQEVYKDIPTEGRTKGWEYMFSLLEGILNNK
jgi:uncharacterized protein YndB with AHSA1/START domain